MILVLSIWEDARICVHQNSSQDTYLSSGTVLPKHRDPHPGFHPEFLSGWIAGQWLQWLIKLSLVEPVSEHHSLFYNTFLMSYNAEHLFIYLHVRCISF